MKHFKLLLVGLVALLTVCSCSKETNLCPSGFIDIYKSGSVKLIVNKEGSDEIVDLKKKGDTYNYLYCEIKSISAVALEDNTTLRINGGIVYLQKDEAIDLMPIVELTK